MAARQTSAYAPLLRRLKIRFTDEALIRQALTHRSYAAEAGGTASNERLEFLGDAVLDLIIAEALYTAHADWPEGMLTKVKAAVVGERSLEQVARAWNLGDFIILSRGEESSGGRNRRALLADAVEAVIGAYYLDQGLEPCRTLVLRELAFVMAAVDRHEHGSDYKTELQEVFQARYQSTPGYAVLNESGPPHDRTFEVAVYFDGTELGRGEGRSKKEAEQRAAERALRSVAPEEA